MVCTASPDKVENTPSPVRSPFSAAETRGRGGRSPVPRGAAYQPRSDAQQREHQQYNNNARYDRRQYNDNKHNNNNDEHKTRQYSDRSPSEKYAPSRRPEVESERWSRGGHASGQRGRGTRGRGREYENRNTRHSPARNYEDDHVDVESRDVRSESSTRASTQSQRVVLVVNVELENGARTQLQIHERDEVTRTARDFCKSHAIDAQLIDLFVEEIASHMQHVSL